MSSQPPLPPADWPVGEPYPPATVVLEDTVVLAPPPPPLPPPAVVVPQPVEPEPGNRIGLGMLLAIGILAAVAAVLAAIYLTRNHNDKPAPAQTVFVTTGAQATTPVAIPVPSLTGLTKADALTQLHRAGFKVTVVAVPGSAPAGTVLAQSPAGGASQASGSNVRLNVSAGPAATGATTTTAAATTPAAPVTASVPTLSGGGRDAIEQLSSAGFLVSLAYVPATTALGNVVSQSPAAGQSARTGSHVTVNLSSGRNPGDGKTVPDVSGKSVKDAVAALQAAGLRLVELKKPVSDPTQVGKIVEQSPAAGKTIPQNAQVLVYWGALEK